MRLLLLLAAALVSAFSPLQINIVRNALRIHGAPSFTVVVDAINTDTFAYTTADRRVIYIDAVLFINAPKTFINVMHHEIDHTRGRVHNNVTGDIMSYHITVDTNGTIIEDPYIWPLHPPHGGDDPVPETPVAWFPQTPPLHPLPMQVARPRRQRPPQLPPRRPPTPGQ